jgi:hypothetical protein
MKTAADMAKNWTNGMQAPQTRQKYTDGINRTTVNPMQLAATPEATQLYLNNVQASVTSGKRQAKLNAANPQTWKANSVNIGANALSTGAQKALPKVQAHFDKWAPIYAQMSQAAKAIPKDGTLGSAMARVQAAIQVAMQAAGRA